VGAEARLQRAGLEAHRRRPATGVEARRRRPAIRDEASVRAFAGGGATTGGRASGTEGNLLGWAVSNRLILLEESRAYWALAR
jgi:hypothetical protein